MADRRANIDLVFRNGLRDLEVLPPPGVWDNIHPVVRKNTNTIPMLRAAAAVAIVATMSFLAYRWGMDVSVNRLPEVIAMDQESDLSVVNPASPVIGANPAEKHSKVTILPADNSENIIAEEQVDHKIFISGNSGADISGRLVAENNILPGLQYPLAKKYAKVYYPEPETVTYKYMQENIEMPAMDRWSISAMASPTYYSQFTSSGNEVAQQLAASDQSRVSYSGGVGLAYKITSRFSIQSGLYYSSMGQELSGVNAYSGFQNYVDSKGVHNFEVMTASGIVFTTNQDIYLNSYEMPERILNNNAEAFDPVKANLSYVSSTIYQDMSFLELPVIVRYKVIDRKVGVNLVGGMSYNFLVNNSVYAVLDGGKYPVGTTEDLNNVSLSSSLGMGMEYKLSQNLSLNLEPTFRYYLNPFNSGNPVGVHPYSIGIFSGVAYKF